MSAFATAAPHHRAHHSGTRQAHSASGSGGGLPVTAIENALQIKGTMSNGVLSEGFDRTDIQNVTLHGVPIKPSFEINGEFDFQSLGGNQVLMNIMTNIAFEPLNSTGTRAAVIPDFAQTAAQVDPLMSVMRDQGWDIGCLYNQETGEQPQLYFSHQFKTGDPYSLAAEVARGEAQTGIS